MYLALIDNLANNGISPMHDMNPFTKLLGVSLLLVAVLLINSLVEAAILFVTLILLSRIGNIPFAIIGRLSLYPAFFSLLFAVLKFMESWQAGLLLIARSTLAAFTTLLLIGTTSYSVIMGVFSLFMPPLLVDIFIFTYRAFFILIDQVANMLRSIRLKGGYHRRNLALNIKNMASTLGLVIIHSIEMSERMYMVYILRGYGENPRIYKEHNKICTYDIVFLSFSAIVLIGVIML